MEIQPQSPPKVQHVTKASSDKILRKFAEVDSDSDTEKTDPVPRKSTSKRPRLGRKKKTDIVSRSDSIIEEEENSPSKENINININNINQNGSLLKKIERKSLLPQQMNNRRSSSGTLLRKFGISKSHSRGFRHKSVLGAIEKTWSKAIRGASKVFMEKHYNRHRILNSDFV
ncbi:uncharacterized protein LOC141633262 [Silene latifolia]|uniref:uncharacterized protein LOC141633262 n=1 Tax=Silene latifolia TaxID=37657 RepID=UPI003D789B8C